MGLVLPAFEAPIEAPKVVSLGDSVGMQGIQLWWFVGQDRIKWKALSLNVIGISEMVDFE